MEHRNLGRSGLKVSAVSLGSWLTYGSRVEVDDAIGCVRAALDGGVTTFDTADIYDRGGAERTLGEAFKRLGVKRRDLVIATKAYWPMSEGPNDRGLSRKHLTESLTDSLERLRTDYVDLYQCHRFDTETPVEEVVRTMDGFIRQGRILYWGVSVWTAAQIEEACGVADRLGMVRPISHQPPYSLAERDIEAEVVPISQRLGLGQIVFSPLAQGLLTGKYSGSDVPEGSRAADPRRGQWLRPLLTPENLARVEKLRAIAKRLEVTLPALALAWVIAQPGISSAIFGATQPSQVAQNIAAAGLKLDATTLAEIDAIWPSAAR